MALHKPFEEKYIPVGCFEYYASGDGMSRLAREVLRDVPTYEGPLSLLGAHEITAHHVMSAYDGNDPVALRVVGACIEFWGMAAANLISIFNPEKIIFGGGVFGPAIQFLTQIKREAEKWAQPISVKQVVFEPSALQGDAGVYGAAYLALKNIDHT
jgi:glucokinase